ncbi:MAG TPA: hypothetical protein VGM20_06255 [Gemmatimonadales bacterium]|jgi:hypothetical protein
MNDLRGLLAVGVVMLGGSLAPLQLAAQSDTIPVTAPAAPAATVGIAGPPSRCDICHVADSAAMPQQRPMAIQLSNGYYTRLHIHLLASYVTLPVMATEFVLGEKLISDERQGLRGSSALTGAHSATAIALVSLFGINTVTGVLNLYEARHVSDGRVRRTIHSILMLAADAGFAYTASVAGSAKLRRDVTPTPGTLPSGADRHRTAAIASISVATAATLMMWIWKH